MQLNSRASRCLLAVLFAALSLATAAAAQTELTGTTSGGAHYRIVVPDGWTPDDGLVIWNHGFSLAPIGPVTDLGPLAQLQLSEGYAVAASSYSLTGWAVFETHEDNAEMVDAFIAEFGQPESVIITGGSLGGIVTARDVEAGLIDNVIGALPICGALAGSRVWDSGIDLRLLYDFVCGDVPNAAIPGGAAGLPFPPDPNFDQTALANAVNNCTGILLPAAARTAQQQANLDLILQVMQIPENFLLTDMGFVTFGLADLFYDPRKLGGAQAYGNANVDYGNAQVNAGIARVAADPAARAEFLANYTPSGQVGDVKIVSLHTDKDGLVVVENESDYASEVPAANLTTAIVIEDVPSHCGFTEAEVAAAWEMLRGWLAGAQQPTAAAIQGLCQQLDAGGLADGPCRIDPTFVIPSIDERVRPRGQAPPDCIENSSTLCLNEDRFRVRVTWHDFSGGSGPGMANEETGDTGSFWFFSPNNLELVVKVLDGTFINGNYWVFYGSLTNVGFELTVTDTQSGETKVYVNDPGEFASVGDTEAFTPFPCPICGP